MAARSIVVTEFDMKRLRKRIEDSQKARSMDSRHVDELSRELSEAEVLPAERIPADVITMNSEVRLRDLEDNEEVTWKLVFPEDADAASGKISVLAPVGTALIGYRVGDIIEWQVPAGTVRYEVLQIVYQPESHGDFHL